MRHAAFYRNMTLLHGWNVLQLIGSASNFRTLKDELHNFRGLPLGFEVNCGLNGENKAQNHGEYHKRPTVQNKKSSSRFDIEAYSLKIGDAGYSKHCQPQKLFDVLKVRHDHYRKLKKKD